MNGAANPPVSARYLLRPAHPRDLSGLQRLATQRAIGISSLPLARDALQERIERSAKSFASDDAPSGDETYLFVLEDRGASGELIGTAGIAAAAGFHDRFYAYRNEFVVQASPALGARNRIHTLHLCHDLTGVTLLTGFHIQATHAHTLAPQLLSRGRLMFIAAHPERFSDRIAAENPGIADDQGRCPFWDAVGRRFFGMDHAAAEALAGGRTHKNWIAELLPQSPIYVPLLPEESQWSLGQLHPVGELPFGILMDEGFDGDNYVNVFDGGPTADSRVALLKTVARRRRLRATLRPDAAPAAGPGWQIVARPGCDDFRATLLPRGAGRGLALADDEALALGVAAGDWLDAAALDAVAGMDEPA
ncbi:Arginine N-succinyltransferase subunit alpha [Rubrivivax sp. A210]|uniref:arginine N-succinyltransferase n=1 Tax=Rubrivivax sp. A210 TaxID=2772301 RepID=UPI00191B0242|nr:arginine N-succinyltransferase [Rubrivivax sp. A210]CAD5375145.1 Arginine N-succinyltransferase subunit alpha [Rubrivivax sp. A210]